MTLVKNLQSFDPGHDADEALADELYRRYATRLWTMAQKRIAHRFGARVAAEDVVQSVFRTFFRRARDGMLVWDGAETLWRLLVRMTLCKVGQQIRRHQAERRDVGREVVSLDDDVALEAVSQEPTPAEAAIFAEEVEAMFEPLDETKAEMLRLSLEGCSTAEVAEKLQCSRWTVRRVLDRIGFQLLERLRGDFSENS